MEKQIAECAGRIVGKLQIMGEMNVLRLSEHLGERSVIAYQALGWLAREGRRVVRLKGGDPFVFGRGGEEAEALRAAGVPFEVVPGVTAGVAVPACSGIPVTHRREAVRVTLLTAHESGDGDGTRVRWDLLAADPCATIVGYMGVTSLPRVVDRLISAGMDPATPAAIVSRGTLASQRTVVAPLRDLPREAAAAAIGPPAVFVIGPTVRRAAGLDWFGGRPLSGERVAIVAPAGSLGEALDLAGAEVVEVALPITPGCRVLLGAEPITAFVLRSEHEVDAIDEEVDRLPKDGRTRAVAWCLGDRAAARALARAWPVVETVPADAGDAGWVDALAVRARCRSAPRRGSGDSGGG